MSMPFVEPPPVTIPESLAAAVGGHPLVAARLARLGLTTADAARAFLEPTQYRATPARALPGIARAAERIGQAIRLGEPICVWGDFDVDGQTATALLVDTLRALGAQVSYHIPVRATESHGVNLLALQEVIGAGARLILTCDTGITAHEALAYAQSRGVDFIITDHHDLPPALPPARAVVSPRLLAPGHPLCDLPGVGVAFKLAEELYRRAGRPEAADALLDLVALGIVADLALLRGDTRYLLQRGLEALRRTERLGLRALMEVAEVDPAGLTEEHIGYVLAPRLNALGRLADANPAVEFLTTAELSRARIFASELEALNARRKLLCDQVYAAAEAQIARDRSLLDFAALVLAGPAWPAGVIGIVASRLAERYRRPAVLIASPPGQLARGSARSVEGVNITAALAAHAGLLTGFGGHPMAAGLSIEPERIPEFRRALSRTVERMRGAAEIGPGLIVDGYLPLADLTPALVADLERLAPFGPGNPPLTLVSPDVWVHGAREIGRHGEHLIVTVADEAGREYRVLWWEGAAEALPEGRFDLVYTVRSANYRGSAELQIEWLGAWQRTDTSPTEVRAIPALQIVDYRGAGQARQLLDRLAGQRELAIWREGASAAELAGYDRTGLPRADALAIWTAPPGPAELRAALDRARPKVVYLFGVDPAADDPDLFLRRLAGLVKHALGSRGGRASLSALAAATAQREVAVRLGLAWLAERGHVRVLAGEGDEMILAPGEGRGGTGADTLAQLRATLAETAAFRAYFSTAPADRLIAGPKVPASVSRGDTESAG